MIRFTRKQPCPVCGGWDQQERGRGVRCWGYLSDDGRYARCTRPEHAGGLEQNGDGTYSHRLVGPCRCGRHHGDCLANSPKKGESPPTPPPERQSAATPLQIKRARLQCTYDYRTAAGALHYQVCRYQPKGFKQRRPDGSGRWIWDLKGVERILYRLPLLASADPKAWRFVVEGEKDVDRLVDLGLIATTNSEGAGKWPKSGTEVLAGRYVVILPDQDDAGRDHAARVREALLPVAAEVRVLNLDAKDASEWLDAGHTAAELLELVERAAPPAPEDGAPLLEDLVAYLRRFLVLPADDPLWAVALWIMHTHCVAAADVTPYLRVQSPEKQSGKTRVIEVCEPLVPAAVQLANATVAAIFRRVDQGPVTLFVDETDAIFNVKKNGDSEDLRALLNVGYRRGAHAIRVVGEGAGMEVKEFECFCPKMLVGLHDLPDTLQDRAVVIQMKRRRRDENVERYRPRRVRSDAQALRDRLATWAGAHLRDLADADPDIPDVLSDRGAECWEPLLAIADAAGGEWPARARAAAHHLSAPDVESETRGVLLLADLRSIFSSTDREGMWTSVLIAKLVAITEHPWADLDGRGKKMSDRYLAGRLREFGVESRNLRAGDDVRKGYRREDLEDAWRRYLPAVPGEECSAVAAKPPPGGEVGVELPLLPLVDGPLEEDSPEPEISSPTVTGDPGYWHSVAAEADQEPTDDDFDRAMHEEGTT